MMDIIEQLKRDEGLRLKPYKDSVGKLTIGYGRNLTDDGISGPEAEMLLGADIAMARSNLHSYLPWTDGLDDARLGVLTNMAFNMGIHGLCGFHSTLACVQAGDYSGAAHQMRASLWAREVGPRAERLATQMESGVWL